MQSEQKKEFLLSVAYYAVLAAALYLFLRYLLWWLLPFLLAFAAARAMEPVILLLRRTVHFKRGFSAALLTLFLLFLLGGLLSLLLSALFTEATAFLTQLPTLLDALPALTGGLLDRLRAYGALCPDWLRELLTAELSDWAAYGSTALAGLASRALALLGSMAAAVPALVLFAATTLLAVFFLAASYPTLCAAAKRRLSPRAQQRLRFWRDGVTHSLTRWLRAQAILCSLTFCQLLAASYPTLCAAAKRRLSPRAQQRLRFWRDGVTHSLTRWLRAQAILCSLTFCQLLAGFWLLGERYSLLAAFLITLVDALPVFGTGTVLIPWALAELLLGSVPRGAALVILYLCTLTVRSITEPKLVAAQAGLPPIASLMAMYLGARAFGVAGMVLFPLLLLLAAQMLRTKKEGSM